MHYVYFLRSISRPNKTYVGMTEDIAARIAVHNAGGCPSTRNFRPWELIAYVAVRSPSKAAELERHFKTGSGHAFWHKRFMEDPLPPELLRPSPPLRRAAGNGIVSP